MSEHDVPPRIKATMHVDPDPDDPTVRVLPEAVPGVRVTVTSYEVSIWPEDCSCIDSAIYCCSVTHSGYGNWKVQRGSTGSTGAVLGADGQWHHERLPSNRRKKELAEHRFDLETALKLAREMAPRMTLNGLTAEEALARHQHGPWCREPYSAD